MLLRDLQVGVTGRLLTFPGAFRTHPDASGRSFRETSNEKGVCPSVKRVDCDKMEERSDQIRTSLEESLLQSFFV